MLAWADEAALRAAYPGRLPTRTPNTITTVDALRQDLTQVRARGGIAYEREEVAQGSVAVAVALRGTGKVLAALQLSGDARVVNLERLAPYVQEAARQASRALFPPPGGRRRSRTVNASTPVPSPWPPGALDRLVQGIGGDYWL
jgi:DNA-binding IclR family transcriptional regulator